MVKSRPEVAAKPIAVRRRVARKAPSPDVTSQIDEPSGGLKTGHSTLLISHASVLEQVRLLQTTFGHNFRAARLERNLKQSEVAKATGLTQQYLSLIEAGEQNVTLRTMVLLAQIVEHSLTDLLAAAATSGG